MRVATRKPEALGLKVTWKVVVPELMSRVPAPTVAVELAKFAVLTSLCARARFRTCTSYCAASAVLSALAEKYEGLLEVAVRA